MQKKPFQGGQKFWPIFSLGMYLLQVPAPKVPKHNLAPDYLNTYQIVINVLLVKILLVTYILLVKILMWMRMIGGWGWNVDRDEGWWGCLERKWAADELSSSISLLDSYSASSALFFLLHVNILITIIIIIIIIINRPKLAYGQQGLAGLLGQDADQALWGVLNVSLRAL